MSERVQSTVLQRHCPVYHAMRHALHRLVCPLWALGVAWATAGMDLLAWWMTQVMRLWHPVQAWWRIQGEGAGVRMMVTVWWLSFALLLLGLYPAIAPRFIHDRLRVASKQRWCVSPVQRRYRNDPYKGPVCEAVPGIMACAVSSPILVYTTVPMIVTGVLLLVMLSCMSGVIPTGPPIHRLTEALAIATLTTQWCLRHVAAEFAACAYEHVGEDIRSAPRDGLVEKLMRLVDSAAKASDYAEGLWWATVAVFCFLVGWGITHSAPVRAFLRCAKHGCVCLHRECVACCEDGEGVGTGCETPSPSPSPSAVSVTVTVTGAGKEHPFTLGAPGTPSAPPEGGRQV